MVFHIKSLFTTKREELRLDYHCVAATRWQRSSVAIVAEQDQKIAPHSLSQEVS